jgi:hypothetical protein
MNYKLLICLLLVTACEQFKGPIGPAGPSGADGSNGADGRNGTSCTVTQTASGAVFECTDGSTATVNNGHDGINGTNGTNGASCSVAETATGSMILCGDGTYAHVLNGTVVEKIALCPDVSGGIFVEYLLKISGEYFGVYASGQHIGLTKLFPGGWVTSDGRSCTFTLNPDGTLTF